MELSVLFLLTSIATARFLDKRKMQVASALYSAMFIIMMFVLLFTVDIEPVCRMMTYVFGNENYADFREVLKDAIADSRYGVYIVGAIILTIAVQVSVTVMAPVRAIIRYFSQKKTVLHKFKKVYERLVYPVPSLYISEKFTLLYCRMLN